MISLNTNYYIISRRYICYEYQDKCNAAKKALEQSAEDNNIQAELKEDKSTYTFMGWDRRIMHLFKHGRGAQFPAFLTWRAALDKKSVMNLLPPLTDGGFCSERISKMLCELHALEYDDACLEHEYETNVRKRIH